VRKIFGRNTFATDRL